MFRQRIGISVFGRRLLSLGAPPRRRPSLTHDLFSSILEICLANGIHGFYYTARYSVIVEPGPRGLRGGWGRSVENARSRPRAFYRMPAPATPTIARCDANRSAAEAAARTSAE